MKRTLALAFILSVFWPSFGVASTEPLKLKMSLAFELKEGPPAGAFSARNTPFVLLQERGYSYWVFNAETHEKQHLAKNSLFGPDGMSRGIYWDDDKVFLLYPSEEYIKRFDPENPHPPEIIPADIGFVSLRTSLWSSQMGVLISEVDPFVMENGKLEARKLDWGGRRRHLPTPTGLVLVDESRYITSGQEDQTLQLWSLPEGKLINSWVLGRWYSSRKITHIAVVQGRLLVASGGGRIEERSLETAEVLWSIRPCRGGAARFHYSSHYRNMGDEFRFATQSINTDGELHYVCGKKFGTLWRADGKWQHHDLGEIRGLASHITAVETLPGTDFVVLVLDNGDVHVLDRKQRKIVQTLPSVEQHNVNSVTFNPATQQLLVIDADGVIHLYKLVDGSPAEAGQD